MSDQGAENSPVQGDEAAPSDAAADESIADEEVEEEQVAEEEPPTVEEVVEEPKLAKKRKQNLIKRVMEYDLSEMYPEMSVLTEKKKREWDYQDPETIRALWLESKTNVLAEWKVRYLNIKKKGRKPQIEVRDTTAHTLRIEFLKTKEENAKNAEQRDLQMIERGRQSPKFDEVKLPTNTTTDMRYKYTRNNPPVPRYYLEHFDKHKKPPFKVHGIGLAGCKPY